jgi:hypothetical protein
MRLLVSASLLLALTSWWFVALCPIAAAAARRQQQRQQPESASSQAKASDDYYAILGLKKSASPKQIKKVRCVWENARSTRGYARRLTRDNVFVPFLDLRRTGPSPSSTILTKFRRRIRNQRNKSS